jgi:hypothetical protein
MKNEENPIWADENCRIIEWATRATFHNFSLRISPFSHSFIHSFSLFIQCVPSLLELWQFCAVNIIWSFHCSSQTTTNQRFSIIKQYISKECRSTQRLNLNSILFFLLPSSIFSNRTQNRPEERKWKFHGLISWIEISYGIINR